MVKAKEEIRDPLAEFLQGYIPKSLYESTMELLNPFYGYMKNKTYPLRLADELKKLEEKAIAQAIQQALGLEREIQVVPVACSDFLPPPTTLSRAELEDFENGSWLRFRDTIEVRLSKCLEIEFGEKPKKLDKILRDKLHKSLSFSFPPAPANSLGPNLKFNSSYVLLDNFWGTIWLEIGATFGYFLEAVLSGDTKTAERLQLLLLMLGKARWPILGTQKDQPLVFQVLAA